MAVHWKKDIHREVDEIGAPEERYEDRSYALAIEHAWQATDALTITPGYAYTVQDGRQAEKQRERRARAVRRRRGARE